MSESTERTLLVKTQGQLLRVTIPDDAKVTFASVNPQTHGFRGHCLRIYKGSKEGPQLAVFTDVLWFRDVDAVKVQRQVKQVREHEGRVRDGKGHSSGTHERDVQARWEDADDLAEDVAF